jgi:hypothetical protein
MNVYQLMRVGGRGGGGLGGGRIGEKKTNSCASYLFLFWIALLFYMLSEWMAFKEVYSYTAPAYAIYVVNKKMQQFTSAILVEKDTFRVQRGV